VTGGDVRGTDRDRAAEALHDRAVERTKPDAGVIDPPSSVFGGAGWGARAMILVNPWMPFNSESKQHEQKSRGFAGL